MKLLGRHKKTYRSGNHFYYGELGENPHVVAYMEAKSQEELGQEPPHYSRAGHKYFLVPKGKIEVEVNDQLYVVDAEHALWVEPGEVHRVTRLVEGPAQLIVFGTVKDPTGADKVILGGYEKPSKEVQ